MVEACTFVPSREPPPERRNLARFRRLYYGSEFCECKIPTEDELDRVLDLGLQVSVVTPIVGEDGMKQMRRVLDFLGKRSGHREIVINDFGVLELVQEYGEFVPVLGRLLTRHVLDLDKGRLVVPSAELLGFLGDIYGVSRYEITNYRSKIEPVDGTLPAGVHLTLYYPYMYLATTRQCLFRFRNTPEEARAEGIACDYLCRGQLFRFEYPGIVKEPLYLKGNTLFACFDDMEYTKTELARLGVDRIVFSKGLPV